MVDSICLTVGLIFMGLSIIACAIPVIPGPALALCGLSLLFFTSHPPTILVFSIATIITIIATVIDYVLPAIFAKKAKCSRSGTVGCIIGSFVGFLIGTIASIFLTIIVGTVIMILALAFCPTVGTILGELYAKKTFNSAVIMGAMTFLGYVVSLIAKVISCIVLTIMLVYTYFA